MDSKMRIDEAVEAVLVTVESNWHTFDAHVFAYLRATRAKRNATRRAKRRRLTRKFERTTQTLKTEIAQLETRCTRGAFLLSLNALTPASN